MREYFKFCHSFALLKNCQIELCILKCLPGNNDQIFDIFLQSIAVCSRFELNSRSSIFQLKVTEFIQQNDWDIMNIRQFLKNPGDMVSSFAAGRAENPVEIIEYPFIAVAEIVHKDSQIFERDAKCCAC